MPQDGVGAVERTRESVAEPQFVFPDGLGVEERVEGDDAGNVGRAELTLLRNKGDELVADLAVLLLTQVQERNACSLFVRVAREDVLHFSLGFGGQNEGHGRSEWSFKGC